MISEDVEFLNEDLCLAGTLYLPENSESCSALIVMHAANGGLRSYPFYDHLTTYLPERNIGVFLFDRRGSGNSGGQFETASFNDLASDGIAALEYLSTRTEIDPMRIGLYGISQGGWIAPIVAAQKPEIAFQIIVSGCGVTPAKQMDYAAEYSLREAGFSDDVVTRALFLRNLVNEYCRENITRLSLFEEINKVQNEQWFPLAYLVSSEDIPEDVTREKWYYELDYEPLPIWNKVACPTLFVFAEKDRWVPVVESLTNLEQGTSHLVDVSFEVIPGADHLMSETNNNSVTNISVRYLDLIMNWLEKRSIGFNT